jgi:zinc/manganese transport system ATP-binding protein
MTAAAITLHDLTVTYSRHPAVHHLSGAFARGSLTAVVGPNGAGKSSLLEAMVGRLPVASGRIAIADDLKGRIAYLPQQSQIDRSFPVRVLDVALLGHWSRLPWWTGAKASQREQALQALATVGLSGFEARWVNEMSTGQFQRLLFARLLLQDSPLILLDEPFTAIDERTCADLLVLMQRWHAEGRTIVAVLHDIHQVRAHFPNTLLLAREAVGWGPTDEALSPPNLARAREISLHWDDHAAWCDVPGQETAQHTVIPAQAGIQPRTPMDSAPLRE